MAAAFSGQDSPSRAPDEYVRTLFDVFADSFDSVLKTLDYRGPELLATALRAAGSHRKTMSISSRDGPQGSVPMFSAVLDAGCGTGLCGPHLRQLSGHLAGVDLSPKMLHYAKQRGCYDELVNAELGAFMRSRPQTFDAIVCSDTFVYFGALTEPLTSARTALRAGGPLVFTVESLPESDQADHRLGVTGRYQHSETYLRRVLSETGFMVDSVLLQIVRQNTNKDGPGYLVVARQA
jgi:predicted TPR repeat methyltransferase